MPDPTQKSYLYLAKPSLIKEWHPTKNGNLNPKNVTTEHGENIWWLCESGHEWEATVKDRIMGVGCLVCATELAKERSLSDESTISQKANPLFQLNSHDPYKGIEYRKYVRYKYKATAMIEDPISGNSIYGQMQNISNRGMYLETNAAFKQGEKITIKFNKPLNFTRKRTFPSTVRWCKELADAEGYGLGVNFS